MTRWLFLFPQILGYFDYAFTSIFTVEILLKVTSGHPPHHTPSCPNLLPTPLQPTSPVSTANSPLYPWLWDLSHPMSFSHPTPR